jgi:hypothetical protein
MCTTIYLCRRQRALFCLRSNKCVAQAWGSDYDDSGSLTCAVGVLLSHQRVDTRQRREVEKVVNKLVDEFTVAVAPVERSDRACGLHVRRGSHKVECESQNVFAWSCVLGANNTK